MHLRARLTLVMAAMVFGGVTGACKDGGQDELAEGSDENDPYGEHQCDPEDGWYETCDGAACGDGMKCEQEGYTGCWTCVADPDTGDGDGDGEPDTCSVAAAALAPTLTSELGGCDIVVRFDYETLEPIALSSICGDYKGAFIGEDAARMTSECCSEGQRLSPADDDGFFLFYQAPGDFGGVTAVSNHLVTRTFEGTIVWDGAGEISYPIEWTTPLDWGFDCEAAVPEAQSYDLIVEPGAPIDAIELEALLVELSRTAVLPAIASANNTVYRLVVLAYPRSVGAFDSSSAEYVVLLEAGA